MVSRAPRKSTLWKWSENSLIYQHCCNQDAQNTGIVEDVLIES
jgi:hypothetical protein